MSQRFREFGWLSTMLILAALPATSQEVSVETLLRAYLLQDCGTGESDPSEQLRQVVALGEQVVPRLLRAIEEGPSASEQEQAREAAEEEYQRTREFLQGGGLDGLENKDVVTRANELTEEDFVSRRMRSFVRTYQERAVNALVVMKPGAGDEGLRRLANDEELDAELREFITTALEESQR